MKIKIQKMKNHRIIFSLIFLVGLIVHSPLKAQTFSENQTIVKTYPVLAKTNVEVDNKYGKVNVITWAKDSVKFVVDVNISSNNLDKLRKIKNSVNIDFTSTQYYVTALTDFGSTSNQIFTELRNLSDALIPGKNTIEINYTIFCPESVNLSITNKFGDIYIDDIRGEIKINLSNGDMKINSISGNAQISLDFGSGIINHISDALISVSYSDLNIKAAEKVKLVSKSSTLNITDIDLLNIDSKRDKFYIDQIQSITGTSNFSSVWIENLYCRIDCSLKFGNLNVDKIYPDFCDINVSTEFADISLYLDPKTLYEADIFYPGSAFVSFPGDENQIGLTTVERSEDEWHSFYKKGGNENLPQLRISALQKCYINLVEI
jgi:hypothetical protein